MEETEKEWHISREAQDASALKSHKRTLAAWNSGFFDDLVVKLDRDANPRADTSAEKLAALKPVFDKASGKGTPTAGNSSPITDGAARCWIASEDGLARHGLGFEDVDSLGDPRSLRGLGASECRCDRAERVDPVEDRRLCEFRHLPPEIGSIRMTARSRSAIPSPQRARGT
ncbi:hypothetical protein RFN29_24650 [Mesorhizobium sp. VK22B]|uniref:Thiolase N-terminal domain-containing protein n=1 Tax=Mesorhizobium captivum TaxID=3072319 RepID=A0ABU4Z6F0_9HYPH|nr:hypothetical protein [Mesorhizobium sp. VK22B]MDX8494760.1 hypothetical protein [Mesorhizobium sp. VK22B]